jgi:hypothetical protein
MLPVLGLLKLPARQLIGYTALQLIVNLPLVLLILWLWRELSLITRRNFRSSSEPASVVKWI